MKESMSVDFSTENILAGVVISRSTLSRFAVAMHHRAANLQAGEEMGKTYREAAKQLHWEKEE